MVDLETPYMASLQGCGIKLIKLIILLKNKDMNRIWKIMFLMVLISIVGMAQAQNIYS